MRMHHPSGVYHYGDDAERGEDERSHLQASHGRGKVYQACPCGKRHQVPHPRRTKIFSCAGADFGVHGSSKRQHGKAGDARPCFINWRTGEPAKNSSYDTHLYKLFDEAGIGRFCMHVLRHTYAMRAIESVVQPKVLQKLLGHGSIKTTMDRYIHVTTESLDQAVRQFEMNGVI